MTFLTVLITFGYQLLAADSRSPHRFGWIDAYCRRLGAIGPMRRILSHGWGAALVIAPVLLVTVWLQWLATDLAWLIALGFGVFVLLISIGPRDLGADAESFIAARDAGDDAKATALAQTLCLVTAPDSEPRRSYAVARAVVVLANRRLVGPVFWFVVLGPVGALGYRLIHVLDERVHAGDCPGVRRESSARLRQIADWLPARVTAAGYAIAGSFDAVAQTWRDLAQLPAEDAAGSDALLASVGLAALDTFPDDAEDLAGEAGVPADSGLIPPVVEDAMALVWRSLVVWMAMIGGGSLIAAIS